MIGFMFQEVRQQWWVVLTSQKDSWVHQNSRYEKGMISWPLKQLWPKDIGTYSRNVYSDTKCIYKFSKWKFVCIFCLLFVPTHICFTCFLMAFKVLSSFSCFDYYTNHLTSIIQ